MWIRTMVERASRGRTVWRRVPRRVGRGRVLLTPESALQYWRFNLDHRGGSRLLFDFAERYVKPGDVVYDIGANCGVFGVAAASMAGRNGQVLALEPDRFLNGLLHQTASVQSPESAAIEVLCCAASDRIGTAVLNIANRGRSTNFLNGLDGRPDSGGARRSERVLTATIDWLASEFRPPNVLKIDVEGAEALVMQGAHEVLSTFRPVVLCEVGLDTRSMVETCLSGLRYRLTNLEPPVGGGETEHNANILAIP